MADAAWLTIPACLVGVALMLHGFNFVTIHKHYHKCDKEDK